MIPRDLSPPSLTSPALAPSPLAPRRPPLTAALLIGLGLLAAGCLTPQASQPRATDGLSCGQRLVGGSWHFTGFVPVQPLDPQAKAALERLHGSLQLSFDGHQALTTGPGIYHVGPYDIINDDGVSCVIRAPDDYKNVADTPVRFVDTHHLQVLDQRSAVPGTSTLERVLPPPGR